MDLRPDTSSGRSQDGWSFLNHGRATSHDAHTRSIAPSSYIRSDRSSISPLPNGHYNYNGSRSSLSRNIHPASTGARSTTTLPSQPVLLRINSANAYDHNHRAPRRSRRPIKLDASDGLPAQEELSIQGILSAIREDIEGDLNTISEILGRSRFVLADQYESQMPPQGEILMRSPLEGIEEGAVDERQPIDDIGIVHEDASLIEGSNSGSAAYRLMERFQTVTRPARINSDSPIVNRTPAPEPVFPVRTYSSPAAVEVRPEATNSKSLTRSEFRAPDAIPSRRSPIDPIVSETHVSAEANIIMSTVANLDFDTNERHSLYSHDEAVSLNTTTLSHQPSSAVRMSEGWAMPRLSIFTSWFTLRPASTEQSAEARLRSLLNR